MDRIPVAGPSVTQLEIDYVTDAVSNCWYGNANKYHDLFERAFADYVGVQHAVALPSCTSAIHLALAALGIGPGDEVIVPDVTWIASAAPITYVGATTVFADIEETTWCLSPRSFEACITERTKAVIPVDLYGNMPRMDEILSIARQHQIAVIEDSAEAFGSRLGNSQAGSLGDCGVFSFHGSKTITTGEGGMLVTDNTELYRRVMVLRDHGRDPGDVNFFNKEVAFKYKMSSMQAALGLAQVERANEIVAKKKQIYQWYAEALAGTANISLNPSIPNADPCYWMTTLIFDRCLALTKEMAQSLLAKDGIDTRPFFHPLSSIPAYEGHDQARAARSRNAVSYDVSSRGINLPSHLRLTQADVARVAAAIMKLTQHKYRASPAA